MKKFKYRLESLLKVKAHLEKEKQKAHAFAVKRVQDQVETLKVLDDTRQHTLEGQKVSLRGVISVTQAVTYTRYLLKLKKDTLTGQEMLRVYEGSAEQKRQDLVDASRDRKIYDKLKDKLRDRHLKEIASFEQKQADEIANTCFIRGSAQG